MLGGEYKDSLDETVASCPRGRRPNCPAHMSLRFVFSGDTFR